MKNNFEITPRYIMGLSLSALRGNENSTRELEEICYFANLAIEEGLIYPFNSKDINFPTYNN